MLLHFIKSKPINFRIRPLLLVAFLLAQIQFSIAQAELGIIPYPQTFTQNVGSLNLTASSNIVYTDPALQPLANILQEDITKITGLNLAVTSGASGNGDIELSMNGSLPDEGYTLNVNSKIVITGKDYRATVWGISTLLQSMNSDGSVKQITVSDSPDTNYRGLMVDLARQWHPVQNVEDIINLCRLYKINYLQLHLTDSDSFTFPSTAYPALPTPGRSYTLAELHGLEAYSQARGVTIIPELEVPGHAGKMIAAYPNLFGSATGGAINFARADVRAAVGTIIGEIADVFQATPYFHTGCDEVDFSGMNTHPDYINEIAAQNVGNVRGLFNFFINEMNDYVKARGKTTLVWEGFDASRTGNAEVDNDVIACPFDNYGDAANEYAENGYDVLNTSWYPLYLIGSTYVPAEKIYDWELAEFGRYASATPFSHNNPYQFTMTHPNQIIGAQTCSWEQKAEWEIPSLRSRISPMSERIWNVNAGRTFDDYQERFEKSDVVLQAILATAIPEVITPSASYEIFPDKILIQWRAEEQYPSSYTLYRNTTNSSATATPILSNTALTTYEDTNVTNGQTYYYWIKAHNSIGTSAFGNSADGRTGSATLVDMYEPFDYTVNAGLNGLNGGTGFSSGWNITSDQGTAQVVSPGLEYPNLVTSGNSLSVDMTGGSASFLAERQLSGSLSPEGSEVWASFLIKANKAATGHSFVHIGDGRIGKKWGNGIYLGGTNTQLGLANGETNLIVLKIESFNGSDNVHVWTNPVVDGTPPDLNDPNHYFTDREDVGTNPRLLLNTQYHGEGQYELDEFRIGDSYIDVLPPSASCPGGGFVGAVCDDTDPCTINDVIDINCNCVGTYSDGDNDGVCDGNDICPVGDDNIDTDNNGTPDACDVGACTEQALDNFSYTPNTSIDGANGGLGFSNAWSIPNAMNGSMEVLSGSLDFAGHTGSLGNKLRLTLQGEDASKWCIRDLANPFQNGDEVWISCLINPIVRADGGFWIKPNGRQDIAIGKRWGSQLSIDNNATSINAQENVVTKLVVRYKLEAAQTVVHLWIDRNEDFTDANADATKTVGAITSINSIQIAMERWGDGVMEIDELKIDCATSEVCLNVGMACDDNDVCTTGDVYDADCNCVGTIQDADNDGVCDANDACPNVDDALIGTACDDGDPCTTGAIYDNTCNCTGGIFQDTDNDGICDANDPCPTENDCNDCSDLLPQQTNLVLGGRRILVLRGVDPLTHTWDVPESNIPTIQTELDAYVRAISFDRAWISDFDVTPVYNFNAVNNTSYTYMSDELRNLATANGYDLSSYNVIIYTYRSSTDLGGAGALGSGNGLNGSVWYPGQLLWYYKGVIHETFHGFGLGHAETIEGGNEVFPGNTTGGHDPYHFMGSEGDGGLNSDIPNYMKYFLGWINPSEVRCVPETLDTCLTQRIYEYSLVDSYNNQHKYATQLGENLWISYEPDNQNSRIEKAGVLMHYIPGPGSAVPRLLDFTPQSITELPPDVSSNYEPVIDFWDAAMEQGDVFNWNGTNITMTATGGTGDQRWVDIEYCSCIVASGDDDNDGVCNDLDMCADNDDNLDMDEDNIPDACDACPEAPTNDSNADGICDNLQCLKWAQESFDYPLGMDINSANGGTGLTNNWEQITPDNGVIEFTTGSLSYPDITAAGEKLHIRIADETTNTVAVLRDIESAYINRDEFWMSILVKGNTLGAGGIWIKPGNRQDIAIGKRWGTQFAIDNNGSPKYMQANNTYWLVAKYELKATETIAKLWVNPDAATFDENNPDATKTVGVIGSMNSVAIAVERYGLGDYEFDELQFNCAPPYPLTCLDADTDGVCDVDDDCPDLHNALIGTACDDGNVCTEGETYDANCACTGGTIEDADNDGVCDADDICAGGDDTIDSDGDGIPDFCDSACNIGASCDDNNACTTNDVYDANCNCAGTFQDADNDGVCDANDACSGLNDALIGTACDDGDPNTSNDTWGSDCTCAGTPSGGGCTITTLSSGGTVESSNGSQSCTTFNLGGEYEDISFALSGINSKLNGKPSSRYIDLVTVRYVSGGSTQTHATYTSNSTVDIAGSITAVIVCIQDNDGQTGASVRANVGTISACVGDGTPPACTPGTTCDDGNNCTTGDTYDADCNCVGTYTDMDADGVCVGNDPNDNDPCVPNACGACTNYNTESFEGNWGIWNDGGNDVGSDATYVNTGTNCVRLRDNSGQASSIYTDVLNLSAYSSLDISFSYIASSMETGEDFLLEMSTNGGSSYSRVQRWISGTDFINGTRYNETVTVSGMSSSTVFRIRCDASANNDRVYIDDVVIEDCSGAGKLETEIETVNIFPNPSHNHINVDLSQVIQTLETDNIEVLIFSLDGKRVYQNEMQVTDILHLNIEALSSAQMYLLHLRTDDGRMFRGKFVKF